LEHKLCVNLARLLAGTVNCALKRSDKTNVIRVTCEKVIEPWEMLLCPLSDPDRKCCIDKPSSHPVNSGNSCSRNPSKFAIQSLAKSFGQTHHIEMLFLIVHK